METKQLRFIIPMTINPKSEEAYLKIKQYIVNLTGFALTNRKIRKLEIEHNGPVKTTKTELEVGKNRCNGNDIVVAILETKGWYIVCTKSRAALTGSPSYIDAKDVIRSA